MRTVPQAPQSAGPTTGPRAQPTDNPFMIKYRHMSGGNGISTPRTSITEPPLVKVGSTVSTDTLDKAREKLLYTPQKAEAKLRFEPQKRNIRGPVGAAVSCTASEGTATALRAAPPPLTKPARGSFSASAPQSMTVGPSGLPGDMQQRLSIRSGPHSPETPAKEGGSDVPQQTGPAIKTALRNILPVPPPPPLPVLASNRVTIRSPTLSSDAGNTSMMENAPQFGTARTPHTRSPLFGREENRDQVPGAAAVSAQPNSDRYSHQDSLATAGSTSINHDNNSDIADSPAKVKGAHEQNFAGPELNVDDLDSLEDCPVYPNSEINNNTTTNNIISYNENHHNATAARDRLPAATEVPMLTVQEGGANTRANAQRARGQEWIQMPTLFYLFVNILDLQELQHHRKAVELQDARQRNGTGSSSLLSEWDDEREAEMSRLQSNIAYAVYDVDGLLLNPLFASWSDQGPRQLVSTVTKTWKHDGPDSEEFQKASLELIDAISADLECRVECTALFTVRDDVARRENFWTTTFIYATMFVVGIACIILNGIFGRKYVAVCATLSAILGLALLVLYVLAMLVLHHNTYADAAASFFREEALNQTKTIINQDDEDMHDSFERDYSDSWSDAEQPLHHQHQTHNNGGGGADGFPSMIGRNMQPDDPVQRARLERDRENALLMTSLTYGKHQQSMTLHREQALRKRIDGSPFGNDIPELSASGRTVTSNGRRISAQRTAYELAGLSADICITALIWCRDGNVTANVVSTLWKHNFLVFTGPLAALDKSYRHGSERFKVFLLNAADLVEGSEDYELVADWLQEKRPVYFFSCDVRSFPAEVPLSTRLEVPFSEHDIATILLAGAGIDEEVSTAAQPMQPFKVPPYTLGRRLGGGAYGNVFEAEMEATGAKCAVKRMYLKEEEENDEDENAGPSAQLREIAQEVEIMSSLAHPNIVKYMFCERDDNCISIFMELCSGGSLTSLINNGELGDPAQVKRILTDIISAVAYLHNKRIVHRDMKPDNVLFRDGRAKVTDFGTAVLKRERGDLRLVKGTFAYMAPEILCGEPYGKACDVWSIGCIAADVLFVDLPQRAFGLPEMGEYYRQMQMDSALEIDCDVPTVKDFLCCCLQRNPAARLTTAELLQHDMLRAENTALAHWMETVAEKHRLQEQTNGPRLKSTLTFDLVSNNASLQSSMILTPPPS